MSKQPPAGRSQNAQPTTEKAGARVVLWLLFALAVLFGGLYAGAHFAAGDKVPKGTTVSGVKIGGHPQTKAAAVLQAGLADRVNRPIELAIEGQQDSAGPVKVDPVAAGLSVDYEASVAEAGGQRSWDPVRLWNYFTGGEKLAAVIDVDESAYNAELTRLQEQYGTAARDAAIRFDGADIVKTEPVSGRAFDPADTLTALQAAFLAPAPVPAALTLSTQVPQIDAADMQEALDAFASPVVAAPITLEFDGRTIELAPDEFTSALSLKAVDGELVPTLNKSKLTKVMSGVVSQGAPVDATVALVAGKPQVVAAKDGVVFVKSQLEDGFLDLVSAPEGERNLALDSEVAQPEFSTADAEALRIHERVSTFTTYYPHADYRNINLGRAGELIDGTVLKPGETFSLNGTVGERTVANGFTEGYIIADGILIQDLGGGVSQMATTLFNAMFFAGLKDIEHLRFKNDTPYGVLIDVKVTKSTPSSSGQVTVSMYSTKWWKITNTTGPRVNLTSPTTRYIDSVRCHPNSGYGGFDITVKRFFEPIGKNSENRPPESFHTTYTPSDSVVCTNPNAVDG